AAIARPDQAAPGRRLLRLLRPLLLILDTCREDLQRAFLVLVLAAIVLALDHDTGGNVRDSHRRLGFVDVLPAGAGGAEYVNADLGRVDLHVVDVVGLGKHRHRAGRRVDAPLRLGRGDALHTMAAGFELQLRIRARADDAHDHLLVATKIRRAFG